VKIAQIAPLYEAVPPRLYGGTERVVAYLTDALVALGHDVTLFSSADARTTGRLIAVRDQAIRLDPAPLKSDLAAHMNMLAQLRQCADQFDILHFHTDMIHFPFFAEVAGKTLTTLHGRLDLKDLEGVYGEWQDFGLISISQDQRRPLPRANWKATVHHGLPEADFAFSPQAQGYLAFLGRISPEKRPDRAIQIATALNMKLKIAAKVDAADKVYWDQVIEPMVRNNPLIEFIGEIGDREKPVFLGGAEALLFPIDWPEPFGLVMIEAMACGTPVVAFRCGSTSEIIEPNVTGFLVDTMDEAIEATTKARHLDRTMVRQGFDRRFSATTMAEAYLTTYAEMVAARAPALQASEDVRATLASSFEPRTFGNF